MTVSLFIYKLLATVVNTLAFRPLVQFSQISVSQYCITLRLAAYNVNLIQKCTCISELLFKVEFYYFMPDHVE